MLRIERGARETPMNFRLVPAVLLITAALALSACDTVGSVWSGADDSGERAAEPASEGKDSAASSSETGQVVEIISSETEPAAPPVSPAEPQADALSAVAAVPPDPAINDDPQQLIGMGPASLNAFLGAPELIRREAPASLWQYRAEDCVLDVVLYPDRGGDKVTYLEAREDGATKMPPRTCLNKLLRARYDGTAG